MQAGEWAVSAHSPACFIELNVGKAFCGVKKLKICRNKTC